MKKLLLFSLLVFSTYVYAIPATIDNHIKTDQFGYRLNDQKVAVISNPINGYNNNQPFTPGLNYQVRRWSDDSVFYSSAIVAWNGGAIHQQSGDRIWWFDFSNVTTPGTYYIYDVANNVGSYDFEIAANVYDNVMRATIRSFYYQRCGTAKTIAKGGIWNNTVCHKHSNQDMNCRLITDQGNAATEKILSGGWHDAGDYNKYVNFTYSVIHDLLFAYENNPTYWTDNYNIPESGNGIPDILDETKYELNWLIKMQQTDGSVLMKVSTTGFQSASPPSADNAARYYGPAQASATRVFASVMAHAAIVYKSTGIPSLVTYSNTLKAKAEKAWTWLVANPAYSHYDNAGFSSANPEISEYEQLSVQTGAAAYLWTLTAKAKYKTYFDANYSNMHPLQWYYWYPFEQQIQDAMLYYCNQPGATVAVKNAITSNAVTSVNGNNTDLLPAYLNNTDGYRAFLKDGDYVWGSNISKANVANLYHNMLHYNLSPANNSNYRNAGESYLHFMHGVNAMSLVLLSNMNPIGGNNSHQQIYHGWFGDGTAFDFNPPPGYVTGGINKNYAPDAAYSGPPISPPQNQPVQKSYKDWNTSWPENSWEISEPAIYTQAAYVRMLSHFVGSNPLRNTEVSIQTKNTFDFNVLPNPATDKISLQFFGANFSEEKTIEIYAADGSKIYSQKFASGTSNSIDISNLNAGIYFVKVISNGNVMTKKFVKCEDE